jgi:hypothetical protein
LQHRGHCDRRVSALIPVTPAHHRLLMSHSCDDLQGLPSGAFFANAALRRAPVKDAASYAELAQLLLLCLRES